MKSSTFDPSLMFANPKATSSFNVRCCLFQSEVQQLRDMGIEDEALSLRALQATNGNVEAACNLIFEGGLD